ncbi:glycosyltransferase [Rothia nasimurium]|uniref:glycosyltransferase n=1 Tax=Rothia nasimurium TaxID=85336 RepID=UPI003BA2B89D
MHNIDISVVIGFRNWGAERIRMSARSIMASFGNYSGEIIISDYGSDDPVPVKAVADDLGLKYIYTPGDKVWSRSRALNAGFSIAEGNVLVSTDADMLFTPESFSTIYETISHQPGSALFLQCRDLPETMSAEALSRLDAISWDALEDAGRLRPRWGMGGMMAISRSGMNAVRGFDERLHTWGGEDLDFALRARRAGYKTVWIDDPRVRMYHMWHPSSSVKASQDEVGREAVAFNKNVVYNDTTTLRNTRHWAHRLSDATPLVTVALATHNRADLIGETIQSVLMQTMPDFELLIVDDGSTDGTRQVIESFDDPRIRYIYQDNAGISATRNHILRESRGLYTAVIDDDDLMHPRRLEWQLEALTEGVDGAVGAFINFDHSTGAFKLFYGQSPSQNQLTFNKTAPGHGTWLIRTSLLKAVGYDETISSGIDFNVFTRLIRIGANIKHIGQAILLRRMHDGQITTAESSKQEETANQTWRFYNYTMRQESKTYLESTKPGSYYTPKAENWAEEALLAFLPDSLITRDAQVIVTPENLDAAQALQTDGRKSFLAVEATAQQASPRPLTVHGATYADLVKLASLGTQVTATLTGFTEQSLQAQTAAADLLDGVAYPQVCEPFSEAGSVNSYQLLVDEYRALYPNVSAINIYTFATTNDYLAFKSAYAGSTVPGLGIASAENYYYALPTDQELPKKHKAHLWITLGRSAEDLWKGGAS